jgi:alpha-ketoglutarate-dependent taurine dioxygenase
VHDETTTFPKVEPFEFQDRGLDADKAKPNLLNHPGITLTRLTPRIGTEISGAQLSELSDTQKNELALLVAERGVVVFRGQDFKDIGPQRQKEFAQYFGRLHVHVGTKNLHPCDDSELTQCSPQELTSKATSSITTSTWEVTTFIVLNSTQPS